MDGDIEVDAAYLDQITHLSLLVITGNGPSLMGWDWLCHIKLDWTMLHQLRADSTNDLERISHRHKDLF